MYVCQVSMYYVPCVLPSVDCFLLWVTLSTTVRCPCDLFLFQSLMDYVWPFGCGKRAMRLQGAFATRQIRAEPSWRREGHPCLCPGRSQESPVRERQRERRKRKRRESRDRKQARKKYRERHRSQTEAATTNRVGVCINFNCVFATVCLTCARVEFSSCGLCLAECRTKCRRSLMSGLGKASSGRA